MHGFIKNIEKLTKENSNFREVLYTGKYSQLVLMSLKPMEEIGMEVHEDTDQFFRVDSGEGKVILDGVETAVEDGFAILIPAGTDHNVINTSETEDMKLYTIYSPAHHRNGVIHTTKEEAEADDEHFDGTTTE
ncbi:cupin [Candidatus Campbellbacteria bacterium RIFOXYC2_FULL_35_25]|uniref:Cupin n=1 Tax=Candidatus Campbellbacteria bacterium RIFOXYC2_FULL_35_25 TaxID=1797582 RepID=A0A1F5EIL3_9BACT|nr:MAG: cupin [Candidatus Campbellbacteria bacterium RIFOXYC2_FULL_35_25]